MTDDTLEVDGRSFDEFWAEVQRAEGGTYPTTVIRGITVRIPTDLPLSVEIQARAKADSSAVDDLRNLIASLFGRQVLDDWVAAGMTDRELRTVLLWGLAHGRGNPITVAEAYERVKAGDTAGKARPGSTTTRGASSSTGGRSKPTSHGNTTSRRRRSRR